MVKKKETSTQGLSSYILEPGKEFYFLDSEDEEKSGILAVDLFTFAVAFINLDNESYSPLIDAKVNVIKLAGQHRIELHIQDGKYTGNYFVGWNDMPALVIPTVKRPS